MSAELFRAPLFHTRADPSHRRRALSVAHEMAVFSIHEGRIVAERRLRCGSRRPLRMRRSSIGEAVFCCLDLSMRTSTFRSFASSARLDDRCSTGSSTRRLPEEVRMADVAYAHDTARRFVGPSPRTARPPRWCSGSHFAGATASLFEAAALTGLRIICGLVVSDRALRPELHQSVEDAYRDSTELIRRFHRRGGALCRHAAVRPVYLRGHARDVPDACARASATVRIQSHINENPDEIAAVANAFTLGARLPEPSTSVIPPRWPTHGSRPQRSAPPMRS